LKALINDNASFTIRRPSAKQFTKILERFSEQISPNVLMTVGTTQYALNHKTIDRLLGNIDDLFYEDAGSNQGNSDEQLIYAIKNYKDVRFSRLGMTSKYKKGKGGFFKYLHNLDFDLSDFQLYNELNAENYKGDNCFVHALAVAGLSQEMLTDVRLMVKTCELPMHLIKSVADKHNLYIKVSMPEDGKTRVINYGRKDGKGAYDLLWIAEHERLGILHGRRPQAQRRKNVYRQLQN
jgi:hypothetical protein